MAVTVTIESPAPSASVVFPFPVYGHAYQDGSPVPATVVLRNQGTGEILGSTVADGTGYWSMVVNGAVQTLRAATATPQAIAQTATSRRAGTALGQKTATAQRSSRATPGTEATARRSGKSQPDQIVTVRRAGAAQAIGIGKARRSADTTAATTGGSGLVPSNANFDSDITLTTNTDNAWCHGESELDLTPNPFAGRQSSGAMTGSYVGRVYTPYGFYDDGEGGYNVVTNAWLTYTFPKSVIDAATSTVLTFDLRCVTYNSAATLGVIVSARDAGSVDLISAVNFKYGINVAGTSLGSAADNTTLKIASPANGTTYTGKTFDLKAWVESRLTAGKTWADVSHVYFQFICFGATGTSDWYIDNFR